MLSALMGQWDYCGAWEAWRIPFHRSKSQAILANRANKEMSICRAIWPLLIGRALGGDDVRERELVQRTHVMEMKNSDPSCSSLSKSQICAPAIVLMGYLLYR
jgi:hypothetical protein